MPQPGWPGQPGRSHSHYPGAALPPRKPSGAGPVVAVAVIGVLLVGVVVGGLLVARMSVDRTTDAGERYEQVPTSSSAPPSTPTRPTQTVEQPTETAEPTATEPVPSTTARPTPQPVGQLEDHPINVDAGLPAVPCNLPAFGTDPQSQDRFYLAALPCFDEAWAPVLASVNLPFHPPQVQTMTGPTSTPCGNRDGATETSVYCPKNSTIYMSAVYYASTDSSRAGHFLEVLGHEYGHHVQSVIGILGTAWEARYDAGPESERGLEFSRRTELQATCYGGMSFAGVTGNGSVTDQTFDEAVQVAGGRGDHGGPRTHGKPERNGAWFVHGAQTNRTFECNTWAVPAADVS